MSDCLCPVCDTPLPAYTFGRPRVYCDTECRRVLEMWRRHLDVQRRRVAAIEA